VTGSREVRGEQNAFATKETTVQSRVPNEEKDSVQMAVAKLEVQAPHQSLEIVGCRFCFDSESPPGACDRRIPCALVAGDR
jgi:hypothetical protein